MSLSGYAVGTAPLGGPLRVVTLRAHTEVRPYMVDRKICDESRVRPDEGIGPYTKVC
jgi:hypothetical protein